MMEKYKVGGKSIFQWFYKRILCECDTFVRELKCIFPSCHVTCDQANASLQYKSINFFKSIFFLQT